MSCTALIKLWNFFLRRVVSLGAAEGRPNFQVLKFVRGTPLKKLCARGVFCALLCLVGFAPTTLRGHGVATPGTAMCNVIDRKGVAVFGAEVTLTDTGTKPCQTQPNDNNRREIQ